jgi:diaminobutyrate-2-oxoglutarate transaminase
VLIRPECDAWQPGEHTGTFRGNNLAFVAATAVLQHWQDRRFEAEIAERGEVIQSNLMEIRNRYSDQVFDVRGRGLIWGLDVGQGSIAKQVIRYAFDHGLLMESSGADDEVLKIMPALTINHEQLNRGLAIFQQAVDSVFAGTAPNVIPLFPAVAFTNSPAEV